MGGVGAYSGMDAYSGVTRVWDFILGLLVVPPQAGTLQSAGSSPPAT